MLFDTSAGLLAVLVRGVAAYVVLVATLRLSGKRTLSKMNAFDLVVTVALGSTLASIITSRDSPLAEGLLALVLLIALQYVVAWSATRLTWVRRAVKSSPTLLVYRGTVREEGLLAQRVTREEVHAAVRAAGVGELSAVGAVILETDGSFSVIPDGALPPAGTPVLAEVGR